MEANKLFQLEELLKEVVEENDLLSSKIKVLREAYFIIKRENNGLINAFFKGGLGNARNTKSKV